MVCFRGQGRAVWFVWSGPPYLFLVVFCFHACTDAWLPLIFKSRCLQCVPGQLLAVQARLYCVPISVVSVVHYNYYYRCGEEGTLHLFNIGVSTHADTFCTLVVVLLSFLVWSRLSSQLFFVCSEQLPCPELAFALLLLCRGLASVEKPLIICSLIVAMRQKWLVSSSESTLEMCREYIVTRYIIWSWFNTVLCYTWGCCPVILHTLDNLGAFFFSGGCQIRGIT